jgi:5-methylcytosine-specific restriction endonuclease McrA
MTWQSNDPCVPCGTISVDRCYHHIYTRKAHHENIESPWNLVTVCHNCHVGLHARGTKAFAAKYPKFLDWLIENDWYMCELRGTWRHD